MLTIGLGSWPRVLAQEPAQGLDHEVADVLERGKKAGLPAFRQELSKHFLAIGDAAADFRRLTLDDYETLLLDYLDGYKAMGFDVVPPTRPLTLITLADDRSLAAFLGRPALRMVPKSTDPNPVIKGMYYRGTNRLIVFDHRPLGPQLAPRPGYDNMQTLAHEGTHQLTFNTGLLNRRADTPACIFEGLAMYGEVRKLSGRTPPGRLNRMRLDDLSREQRRGNAWIDVVDLLQDDKVLFSVPAHRAILAYAESWLFVAYLLNDAVRRVAFRTYLEVIRRRTGPENRLADASAHLPGFAKLDDELRAYAQQLRRAS
jgi:hypothetical protein